MITIQNLCVGFGRRLVLEGIHLHVARGEWIAVVGKNGCGKTTLLRTICALTRPQAGTVLVAGTCVQRMAALTRARTLAMVPQRPPTLPPLTALDVVLLGRFAHSGPFRAPSRHDRAVAESCLAETGAARLAHRLAPTLSAGELSRVLLAQALAQETPILLLDEPAAHLDPSWAITVLGILAKRHQKGQTIVLVAHDINGAALYCPRFVALDRGRVAYDGPTRDFFTANRLRDLYGTPFHLLRHPVADVPQALPLPVSADHAPVH
ncbi:MAG: ABC transporter ATP-binding protein [Desulfomicrobiaceae bacterium]|nr:ABC transporter ATP-binding protein [Desulfomicrobiaceae bacterium]